MKKLLPFIIFSGIFVFISNWHILITTFTGLLRPQSPYEKVENQKLTDFIQQKTGVTISYFYIVNSDSTFGGMTGIPTRPIMTISKRMYESFTRDELEYVILHEAGHYVKGHTVKEALVQLIVIVLGFSVFKMLKMPSAPILVGAVVSGIACGIVMIQFARSFEWEADAYALQHLEDPQSMIRATQKLQAAWLGPSDESLTRKLFYRGIPYSERIKHAENYDKL